MAYHHLSELRGTKKLLYNSDISIFQLLMDCPIYNNMQSCNRQWNTVPELCNFFISIFYISMEFNETPDGKVHEANMGPIWGQ